MTKEDLKQNVYSFGENNYHQWYALDDNIRIDCNESTISKLWHQWLLASSAKREHDGEYVIFKVNKPEIFL